MRLLLDTQILVWLVNGDNRLRKTWIEAIANPESSLSISPVVAFEYCDLQQRGRLPIDEPLAQLIERFDLVIDEFPVDCWQLGMRLPSIHRDPVDRMLVAHALARDFTHMTADANIRKYPVPVI